jgi:SSS family solute:Na+ symporter
MAKMPLVMQILFFGALLSAIKSTASATLLAPSTTFVENILRHRPHMGDRRCCADASVIVLVFTGIVLAYAIAMQGTSIYELVSGAYQVPLVGAFVPLVFGLYWKRATTQGAVCAVALGIGVWIAGHAMAWGEAFPAQLAGVLAAVAGMVLGSLVPQWLADHKGHARHYGLSPN